ncbi:aminotransferase class IV [Chloroflexota bacterium]
MEEIIFLNGSLLHHTQAKISPFDHGFLYGYGLFETMRAYSGRIFRLERHLDRLIHSAKLISLPLGIFDIEEACYDTIKANHLEDARIRLTVSIGEGEGRPDSPSQPIPTMLIVAQSFSSPLAEKYENGFKSMISSISRNSQSLISRLKSLNYMDNILARMEAKMAGADEAILLNESGFLCEGSTSNIFLVSKGKLLTPNVESGILPGITREAVIELAHALRIEVVERKVDVEELSQAEESFLTNSLIEIAPLVKIDDKPISEGVVGGVTERLMVAYRRLVEREIK